MDKLSIVTDELGNQVVLIPDIIFKNKQNVDWNEVEEYLKQFCRGNNKHYRNGGCCISWKRFSGRICRLKVYKKCKRCTGESKSKCGTRYSRDGRNCYR